MQTFAKPWSWRGLEPSKRSFGDEIRNVFKNKGYTFITIKGAAATPGSTKLHLRDCELAPLAPPEPPAPVSTDAAMGYCSWSLEQVG